MYITLLKLRQLHILVTTYMLQYLFYYIIQQHLKLYIAKHFVFNTIIIHVRLQIQIHFICTKTL